MNIATSSIIIFLLLLPGIVYRRFYYTEEFSKQYFKQNFFELFVSSIIPSVFIHTILSWLISFKDYQINVRVLGQLLTSKDYPQSAFENIQSNIANISFYYIVALIMGVLGGYISKKIIRQFNLDSRHKIIRFKNAWHYVFTGEFFNYPRASFDLIEDSFETIDFVYIDALVDTSIGPIIYDGILVDYELSNEGGLVNISLKLVQRRMLDDDKLDDDEKKGYYEIPGHIMIIPYSSTINLNLSYYKLVEVKNEDSSSSIIPKLVG